MIQQRALGLLEAIRGEVNDVLGDPVNEPELSSDLAQRTLQVVESIARQLRILDRTPGDMANVVSEIGPGRDYSTASAWAAVLDTSPDYSSGDVAIGEVYDDTVYTDSVTIDGGGTVGLAEIVLQAATGESHDGTPGTGARWVAAASAAVWTINEPTTIPTTIKFLEIDYNTLEIAGNIVSIEGGSLTNGRIHNCLIHNAINAAAAANMIGMLTGYAEVLNCALFDCADSIVGNKNMIAINATGLTSSPRILVNNTIHNITKSQGTGHCYGIYTEDANTREIKNNNITEITGSTTGDTRAFNLTTYSTADVDSNLTDDGNSYGTNPLSDTVANLYTSPGTGDFSLKAGCNAIGNGVDLGNTPDGVQYDLTGRDRDTEGDTWSTGAVQYVGAAPANASDLQRRRNILHLIGR